MATKMSTAKKQRSKKIVCLFNSFFGVAGGEIRFVEIFKRVTIFDKVVITPALGETFCKNKGLRASYIQTTKESKLNNVMFTYAFRIIKVFLLKLPINNKDIIYSTSDFLPDVLPAFFYKTRNRNVNWVADIYHIIPPPLQRDGPFIKNLVSFSMQRISLQFIKRRSDLIFVLNKGIIKQLVKLGFPENKIYVTGAGINFEKISQIQNGRESLYDACFLGRLHPSKGIFDLVELWKLVVSKRGKGQLAIIYAGSKDLELALMKKIKEEKLEANIFMFPLTGDEALSMVKNCKVFVFPSHEEGWGIVICEAMACGLPVVAYDLPVYREIFKEGIVTVPLRNIKRFSEEVINLLENDDKRHVLGNKARSQATIYDWDSVAKREVLLMKSELT